MPQNNQILIKTSIQTTKRIEAKIGVNKPINAKIGKSTSGATSYPPLAEKPQINDVILIGNKTSHELGLQDEISIATEHDIDKILYGIGGD